jgi:hypothetical protein
LTFLDGIIYVSDLISDILKPENDAEKVEPSAIDMKHTRLVIKFHYSVIFSFSITVTTVKVSISMPETSKN